MKCKSVTVLIDDQLQRTLQPEELQIIEDHIATCQECKEQHDRIITLKAFLKNDKEEMYPLPEYFDRELKEKLAIRIDEQKKSSFFTGWLKPVAIGFIILFIVFGAVISYQKEDVVPETGELISESTAKYGDPVAVEIEYVASRDIKDAAFTIALDDGVSFHSKYDEVRKARKHTWNGVLKKGSNTIPFALDVHELGKMNIHTRADYEGYSHKHKLILTVTEKDIKITLIELPKVKISTHG